MLITKTVEISITPRTVNHYKEKGYVVPTRYSEKSKKDVLDSLKRIVVKVADLPDSSHVKIQYRCDKCGEIFTTAYCDWKHTTYKELGDLCKRCATKVKFPQSMMDKYGYLNAAHVPSIVDKKKETNLREYGCEWPIASKKVKENIVRGWLQKFQADNPMKNDEVKQKAMATNNKRYGGNSPLCNEDIRAKSIETCICKYGVPYSSQSKEIQAKARATLYKNNNTPTSKPEGNMCNILKEIFGEDNCFASFPVGNLSLDCLVKIGQEKIDVEYDGYYWHKNREQIDAARNAVLMNKGFRVLRIKANNEDTMPTYLQIKEAIDYLVNGNHHLTFIDMNI